MSPLEKKSMKSIFFRDFFTFFYGEEIGFSKSTKISRLEEKFMKSIFFHDFFHNFFVMKSNLHHQNLQHPTFSGSVPLWNLFFSWKKSLPQKKWEDYSSFLSFYTRAINDRCHLMSFLCKNGEMVWQERVALQTLLFGQKTHYIWKVNFADYFIVLTFSTVFTDWKKQTQDFKSGSPIT